MVIDSKSNRYLSKLVLFSERDGCWKLADFGSASKATSRNLNTTHYRRGTDGYRAPEMLDYKAHFNNKANIFASDVLRTNYNRQKLFNNEWAVREYSLKGFD